jgi:hypothetical protein
MRSLLVYNSMRAKEKQSEIMLAMRMWLLCTLLLLHDSIETCSLWWCWKGVRKVRSWEMHWNLYEETFYKISKLNIFQSIRSTFSTPLFFFKLREQSLKFHLFFQFSCSARSYDNGIKAKERKINGYCRQQSSLQSCMKGSLL